MDGDWELLALVRYYATAGVRQRLLALGIAAFLLVSMWFRDNEAKFSVQLLAPPFIDGSGHTLCGKLADIVADIVEQSTWPAIAALFYYWLLDHKRRGTIQRQARGVTDELHCLHSSIKALKETREKRGVQRSISDDGASLGCSLSPSTRRIAWVAARSRVAPLLTEKCHAREAAQRAAQEGMRLEQNRRVQFECSERESYVHAKLDEAIERVSIIPFNELEPKVRAQLDEATTHALVAQLQYSMTLQGDPRRVEINVAQRYESGVAQLDAGVKRADDFLKLIGNSSVGEELRRIVEDARECLFDLQDNEDKHTSRVNITLNTLDCNGHLMMRTISEEPLSSVFPTARAVELLKKSKEQQHRLYGDDFVSLGGLSLPRAPIEPRAREDWEDKHQRKIRDQIINRISALTGSGHIALDMGLKVITKKYAFGVTYEKVKESSLSQAINPKFRILLVARDVLEVAPSISPSDVVPPDATEEFETFIRHRWSNIQHLASFHNQATRDDADGRAVKKRRIIFSGPEKFIALTLPGGEIPSTSPTTPSGVSRHRPGMPDAVRQ
jgi:hypothetical protein